MKAITLEVSDDLAAKLERLTEAERASTLETLSLLLGDKRTLFEVMDDMSEYARKQGLTPEKLDDLLKDES